MEPFIKYLRELYDLKRIVSGKKFEKYNAVQTQFDHFFFFFERTIWVKPYCPELKLLKVFEVVKDYKPE